YRIPTIGNTCSLYAICSTTNFKLKVTIYKADLKTNIYYIIGFVILFGVTILLSSKFSNTSWALLVIFLLLFFVFNIVTSRLNEIQLDTVNNGLTLIYKNYIGIKKALKYDLKQIEFTYKRQATSFRGGIKNVCTIYSSGKKVIQLVPDNDDWSDDEIKNFVYGLIDSNVKKKFIGNILKDVEI
ncbi:MAG: hypothetical protein ABL872_19300, partial [Lacibacter sp.]